jgi:CheY-like chemotaxis protein
MPLTFLVVDGDPSFRTWCASQLRSLGHLVLEADTGLRAAAAIEMCVPDLVLIDERLSDMDGALWVQRHQAACPGARFVVTSSSSRPVDAAHVLPKPVSAGELLERLGRVAGRTLTPRTAAGPHPVAA